MADIRHRSMTMRLRKQDADGDYQFGHNAGDFWHNEVDGVAQSVLTRLLLYRGEWFLDITEGMPWGGFPLNTAVVRQGQVLGAHTELARDVAVQQRVLATLGVQLINNYASTTDPNRRSFSAQMTITTIYGRFGLSIRPFAEQPYFIIAWSALSGADPL
jgi:hypothetical protein